MANRYVMDVKELENIGIPINQAKRIIREAKKKAVKAGFTFYVGKQNFAPKKFVLEILGASE
ncbi:DUF3173 family protein [Lactococcus lactis]|uniref:DUF3173 family protein n=1 Tax=Lactococcus lactis TaxID=1358 RepID=UPI0023A97420|nr:DUF3173 family protein [Lactococcus lactis]WEA55582.1 DUF3173 family protein [Lactococcus lactis]